jgi:hypothetical protein
VPTCQNVGPYPIFNEDFRPAGGGALPPGFNLNLPQSEEPSQTEGTAPFSSPQIPDDKVWQIVLKGFVFLIIILLAVLALKALSRG